MRNGRIFMSIYPTKKVRIMSYYLVNNHTNRMSTIVRKLRLYFFIRRGIRKSPYCVRLLARTVDNQNEEELIMMILPLALVPPMLKITLAVAIGMYMLEVHNDKKIKVVKKGSALI